MSRSHRSAESDTLRECGSSHRSAPLLAQRGSGAEGSGRACSAQHGGVWSAYVPAETTPATRGATRTVAVAASYVRDDRSGTFALPRSDRRGLAGKAAWPCPIRTAEVGLADAGAGDDVP